MAERLTGWHPDPWAVHELRYFSMSGTPTRLVKDGMKASYDAPPNDAPTTPTAPLSPTPALNETKNEPTSAQAISDLLAHLMRSAHRKLAVAEMENDPGRVANLRKQIELWERLVRSPARDTDVLRVDIRRPQLEQSLLDPDLDSAIGVGSSEDLRVGQRGLPEGGQRVLDPPLARPPDGEVMAVKGLAPPPQSPDTRSTPTHPPGASETTLTMPNTAPSPPLAQATKKRKAFKRFRIIYWTMALAVLLISILATIDDFQRTTYYVADINHRVLNPYEIKVSWTVHNTGMRAGTPNCEIHASSPGDEDAGFDTAPGTKPIPAGGQHTAFTTLTISNHGAEHVTDVSVAC